MFSLRDLRFVTVHVISTYYARKGSLAFFILITHKSSRSESLITWLSSDRNPVCFVFHYLLSCSFTSPPFIGKIPNAKTFVPPALLFLSLPSSFLSSLYYPPFPPLPSAFPLFSLTLLVCCFLIWYLYSCTTATSLSFPPIPFHLFYPPSPSPSVCVPFIFSHRYCLLYFYSCTCASSLSFSSISFHLLLHLLHRCTSYLRTIYNLSFEFTRWITSLLVSTLFSPSAISLESQKLLRSLLKWFSCWSYTPSLLPSHRTHRYSHVIVQHP